MKVRFQVGKQDPESLAGRVGFLAIATNVREGSAKSHIKIRVSGDLDGQRVGKSVNVEQPFLELEIDVIEL
jgi:hypothetical protein